MAYLQLSERRVKRAFGFLQSMASDDGAKYGQTGPDDATPGSTAAGLLCRAWFGRRPDEIEPHFRKATAEGYPRNDVLGNYAAQLLAHLGRYNTDGPLEEHWNQARRRLLAAQVPPGPEAGSWYDPNDPSAKRGGRLYHTAMNLLTVAVIWHYRPPPPGSEDEFPFPL